jgi:hypothetical protein
MSCIILGDSIAVGTHYFKQECQLEAKVGINSSNFNKKYNQKFHSNMVIISLGSNDDNNINTYENIKKLREKVSAEKVFWIMPNPQFKKQVEDVKKVSEEFKDTIIQPKQYTKGNVHPTMNEYQNIAKKTIE